MRLLEIVHSESDVLRLVFDAQREVLSTHFDIAFSASIAGLSKDAAIQCVKKNIVEIQPTAILLRGIYGLPAISMTGTKIPIFLDHCSPAELGKTSPLREHMRGVKRAICYSQKSEEDLVDSGFTRITTQPGPFLPDLQCPLPEQVGVAVLDSCPASRQVLDSIRSVRSAKGWKFDIITSMPAADCIRVSNSIEAVERSHLVIGCYDEMDYGQPHEAAILSLGFGRALATSRTNAFSILPYPKGTFISIPAYTPTAFAAAVQLFLRDPKPLLSWPATVKYNASDIPDLIHKWVAP